MIKKDSLQEIASAVEESNLQIEDFQQIWSAYATEYFGYPVKVSLVPAKCLELISMEKWMNTICQILNVPVNMVMSRNRKIQYVLVRQLLFFTMALHSNNNSESIASFLRIDRTTVIHSRDKISDFIAIGDFDATDSYFKIYPLICILRNYPTEDSIDRYMEQTLTIKDVKI